MVRPNVTSQVTLGPLHHQGAVTLPSFHTDMHDVLHRTVELTGKLLCLALRIRYSRLEICDIRGSLTNQRLIRIGRQLLGQLVICRADLAHEPLWVGWVLGLNGIDGIGDFRLRCFHITNRSSGSLVRE